MLQFEVWVYMNQVPFCARQNSYGFTSPPNFGILCPTNPKKQTPYSKNPLECWYIISISWNLQRRLVRVLPYKNQIPFFLRQNCYGFTILLKFILLEVYIKDEGGTKSFSKLLQTGPKSGMLQFGVYLVFEILILSSVSKLLRVFESFEVFGEKRQDRQGQ